MQIGAYHRQLTQKLTDIGNLTAALDARLLICHVLKLDFTAFLLQQNDIISGNQQTELEELGQLALSHMPISRILEKREFWGLDFLVNAAVLDPRADSELLIEVLLHFIPPSDKTLRILDLGTGTGCLLLSLLHEYPNATGMGVDFSTQALDVAQKNAENLGLIKRVKLIQSDWFEKIGNEKFDIILSNPPYIPSQDIKNLDENVKLFDPLAALDGGDDGLNPYRIITAQAPKSGRQFIYHTATNGIHLK
jgi:release factor glutamine methyltransferase